MPGVNVSRSRLCACSAAAAAVRGELVPGGGSVRVGELCVCSLTARLCPWCCVVVAGVLRGAGGVSARRMPGCAASVCYSVPGIRWDVWRVCAARAAGCAAVIVVMVSDVVVVWVTRGDAPLCRVWGGVLLGHTNSGSIFPCLFLPRGWLMLDDWRFLALQLVGLACALAVMLAWVAFWLAVVALLCALA